MLEESTVVDVKYMLTGWVENQIPLTRLHNVPFVLKEPISRKDLRPRQQKCDRSQDSLTQVSDPRRTPVEWLKYGLESRRHEKRGWLKEALQSSSLLGRSENDVWRRVISDYKSQLAHIEGMRAFADHMNLAFEDPRRASNGGKRTTGGLWVTAKSPSQTNIPKNPLTIPYLLHAYGVSRSSFKRRVEADKRGVPIERYDTRAGPKNFFSVIVSRTAAQQKYTPRFFYVQEAIMCEDKEGFGMKYTDRIAQLGRRFDALVSRNGDISRWSRQAREHDARHQYIKQELIDALEAQVCRSYRQLSHRCAAFKIPLRDIRHSSRDPVTGRVTFRGNPIKHRKGVPYLVDCNVTGSDPGTPSSPCFPLQNLWEHCLVPCIENLVAPGGPCEGAQVIFQEDNAGPHVEGTYRTWMQEAFGERSWKVELQAPQGIKIAQLFFFL